MSAPHYTIIQKYFPKQNTFFRHTWKSIHFSPPFLSRFSLSLSQLVFLCLLLLRHFLAYFFAILLIVCFPSSSPTFPPPLYMFSPIFIILCAARRKPLLNETNNTSAVFYVCVCLSSCSYVVQCRRSCSWKTLRAAAAPAPGLATGVMQRDTRVATTWNLAPPCSGISATLPSLCHCPCCLLLSPCLKLVCRIISKVEILIFWVVARRLWPKVFAMPVWGHLESPAYCFWPTRLTEVIRITYAYICHAYIHMCVFEYNLHAVYASTSNISFSFAHCTCT